MRERQPETTSHTAVPEFTSRAIRLYMQQAEPHLPSCSSALGLAAFAVWWLHFTKGDYHLYTYIRV